MIIDKASFHAIFYDIDKSRLDKKKRQKEFGNNSHDLKG
jgi:hypothetical protein